jgi:hypothetical protein
MTDKVYCYHCRCVHFSNEVMLVQTANGRRWRCEKSMRFSKRSRAQRDAFGKSVSQMNQTRHAQRQERTQPHCVLDVFVASDHGLPGLA